MEDIIDIIVTETTNTIEITSQASDELIDVNIIDNREDITLNVTPTLVEININSLTGNFGVEWGDITGTLADQTDLQSALDAKLSTTTAASTYVPYTGATSNVNLGNNFLLTAQVKASSSAGLSLNSNNGTQVANLGAGGGANITFYGGLNATSIVTSESVGIGTSSLTGYSLRVSKNITGATTGYGVMSDGVIQSDVTASARMFTSSTSTQATTFTLTALSHYVSQQGTFGAGSTVTNQYGFFADSSLIGATNNYGFRGAIAAGTNRYNLYMDGTAYNFLAGRLGLGLIASSTNIVTSLNITGNTSSNGIYQLGTVQSDVTGNAYGYRNLSNTQASAFTLGDYYHFGATQGTIGSGSTITRQTGFYVDSTLTGGTNNYGFYGNIASGTNRWNIYMQGTADNYLAGDTGIGGSSALVSSGPILTTTLTNGGSGYVDGTYTDVASTVTPLGGTNALFTIVVSGGIVTTATLAWGGANYKAGTTIAISNALLGGTGSGLIITIDTVDSSSLKISNANGGDITLYRSDTGLSSGENIGTIKFESNDTSFKASGIQAEIGAFAQGTTGGAYLSFYTSTGSGGALTEQVRIGNGGQVGIGSTSLTGYNLRVSKNITGATIAYGITSDGIVQSGVTNQTHYYSTNAQTQATTFTLSTLFHYRAIQGTIGAGSTVTSQHGFSVDNTLIGATNNYGFYGNIASGTNRWNLYMNGTANNYLAGNLLIGSTADNGSKLQVTGGATISTTLAVGLTNAKLGLHVKSGAASAPATTGTTPTGIAIFNPSDGNNSLIFGGYGSGTFGNWIQSQDITALGSNYPIILQPNGGNVVINSTTDTGQRFQVNGGIESNGSLSTFRYTDQTTGVKWELYASASTAKFYNNSAGNVASISQATGIYTPTSDINKKKDFEDSTIGLSAILGLKSKLFRMITQDNNVEKSLGFIAQEVKEYIPQAYVEEGNFIGLSDRPIIAALVKAVQELSAELDTLKK
jgi:hypothetical protein